MLSPISSQHPEALESWLSEAGGLSYRADQVLQWVHKSGASNWFEMTNVPDVLKNKLSVSYTFSSVRLVRKQGSFDTTLKFLWKLNDGQFVESVLIPATPSLHGESSDRHTLCVSTQVGCAYGCKFCASGLEGFKRNLEPAEIIDQVLAVERLRKDQIGQGKRLITNLVIMGMGEPMANYDNLLVALEILNADWGSNIGARKITISTSGLAPQIRQLAQEPRQYRLAISLHGATDEVRDQIMPVNRKHPLAELTEAAEAYQAKKNGTITLEYILIAGINDGLEQVPHLSRLAVRLRAKVNLIPYNKVNGLDYGRPNESTQENFLAALTREGIRSTLRREKGHDIDAACGQLRLRTEKELDARDD